MQPKYLQVENGEMDLAKVLAVEVKQYLRQGMRTLRLRVAVKIAEARQKKSAGQVVGKEWNEASFFVTLKANRGTAKAETARRILGWVKERMPDVYWRKGKVEGSFIPDLSHAGKWHQVIEVGTSGTVEVSSSTWDRGRPLTMRPNATSFGPPERCAGDQDNWGKIGLRPTVLISSLEDPEALEKVLEVLDWLVREVEAS